MPASSDPLRIDVASPRDLPELAGLLGILFAQEVEFSPAADAQRRGLALLVADPAAGTVLVARADGRVVGMVTLLYTISTALGARVALLEDMVVAPAARGMGAGTRLLEAAIAAARERGCGRITLLTDRSNEAAQRFYARQGFTASTMTPMRLLLSRS